jgi:N4-gp56 family major capsid protein
MALESRTFSGNQALILASKMKYEVLREFFWGQFAKFNTPGGIPAKPGNIPQPTDSPIVMQSELQREQGDVIKIPLMRALRGRPTIGLDQMAGFEERMKINHAQVPIDILRHAALTQEGSMMTQTTKDYQILQRAKPLLRRHYGETLELFQISHAFYNGFSRNIIDATNTRWSGHSTIKKISHPHIFISGQGKVSYGTSDYPGTANYETNIGTALGNVTPSHVFDTNFLSGLKAHQQIRRIAPIIMSDGNKYRLIVAHPYQIADLEADPNFKAVASAAFVQSMAKNNPLLAACRYHYAGFFIFESDTAVWPVAVSGGVPVYGPTTLTNLDSYTEYTDDTLFAAIVLGSNALFRGLGSSIEFIGRVDDYDEIKGIAYRTIEGASRADYWNDDDGTRGQYLKNDGSAVLITYAAEPAM